MRIDWNQDRILSVTRQAELLGLSRASLYYTPVSHPDDDRLMRLIDTLYTKLPFYGSRKMTEALQRMGHEVGRRRVRRLMRTMGIEALYPKPTLSKPHPDHHIYPYRLRGVAIARRDQAWGADITYIRLAKGFAYLAQ